MGTSVSHDRHEWGNLSGETPTPGSSPPPGDRSSAVPGALNVQGLVADFHRAYGCVTDVPLADAPDELLDLRVDLLQEELSEAIEAMRFGDALAVARELADLAYVTAGTAVAFGLTVHACRNDQGGSLATDCAAVCVSLGLRAADLAELLLQLLATIRWYARFYGVDIDVTVAEVHRANMSKVGIDGQPVIRPDGKILQLPGWAPPDMRCAVLDFDVPIDGRLAPPWWLDGIRGA